MSGDNSWLATAIALHRCWTADNFNQALEELGWTPPETAP